MKRFSNLKDSAHRKVTFTGTIQLLGNYVNNAYAPASSNGFYSTADISGKLTLYKIPLNAGVQLTFHNQQFRADFTTATVGFDPNAFKDGLKNNYLSYIKKLENYFGDELGTELKHFEDSLKNYDKDKAILSNPNYYKQLNSYSKELSHLEDSLAKHSKDSLSRSGNDSNSSSDSTALLLKKRSAALNDTINKLKKIAEEYETLENYRKQNLDLVRMLDKYHAEIDKIKGSQNILNIPGMEDKLKKAGLWDKRTSLLSGVQKFNIGRVALNLSRYTIQSQSIYGFNLDYLYKKLLYAGVGFGFAAPYSFSTNPNTLLTGVGTISRFDYHRLVGYIRVGVGAINDNHVHLIWTGYGDRFSYVSNDTLTPATPPANSVLSLEAQQKINSFLKFNAEVATSNSSFMHRSASASPINLSAGINYAAMAAIKGNLSKIDLTFGLKGEVVSSNFTSAGNIFLRSGLANYIADLKKAIFKNKLTLSTAFSQNFQGFDGHGPSMQYITSTSTASIRPAAFATYVVSYTLFKQLPYENTSGTSGAINHSLSLLQQYSSKIKKTRLITTLTSTYSRNSMTTSAELPTQTTVNIQTALTQDMFFAHSIQWHVGVGLTYITGLSSTAPDTLSIPTFSTRPLGYWVETGNTIIIKKALTLTYTVRYTDDGISPVNIRSSANATVTLYKGLRLLVRGTYSTPLNINQTSNLNLNIAPATSVNVTTGISYSFSTAKAKSTSASGSKQP